MPQPWWLLLVVFSLASSLVVPSKVVATDDSTATSRGATLTKFESFAFEPGGTVSISAREKPNDSNFKIFIAEQQTAHRVIKTGSWYQFCHTVNPATPLWLFPLSTQDTRVTIRNGGNYYFFLLDCASSPDVELELRYVFLRERDGGQLPAGEVLTPFFQFAFLGLWIFILSVWLLSWLKDWESVVPLHLFWAFILFLKLLVCIFDSTYWWNYYQSGLSMPMLTRLSSATYSCTEGVTFGCFLFLVSRGWRITRAGVPTGELKTTLIITVCLSFGMLFFSFYNSGYLWFVLLFLYILVFPRIFSAFSIFSSTLSVQLTYLARFQNSEQYCELLREKKLIARRIRALLVIYIIGVILLESLLRTLISWNYLWVPSFVSNCISFVFCLFVSIILRPRKGIFLASARDLEFPDLRDRDQVDSWDLKKTLLIQWPQGNVALAYEEAYDKEQSENVFQDQVQPVGDEDDIVFVV